MRNYMEETNITHGHIKKREPLKNIETTGQIGCRRVAGRQRNDHG